MQRVKKVKIAFLTENNRCGGLDTFIINLINYWPNDDELYLICNKSHPGLETIKKNSVRKITIVPHEVKLNWELVGYLRTYRLPKLFIKWVSLVLDVIHFPYLVFKFRRMLNALSFDNFMVINGGYPAGMSCRAATVAWGLMNPDNKAIHNFHNFAVGYRPHNFFHELLYDYLVAKNSKAFITVSKSCAKSLFLRKSIVRSIKPGFIYNGMGDNNLVDNKGNTIRSELGLSRNSSLCLMLGVYEPRKGHEFIFRVFKQVNENLPSAHLVICGHGSNEEMNRVKSFKEKIAPNCNIHLLEFRLDALSLIAQSDVVVVPSQEFESFGYMALEAMSQKTPVVSTNVGGLPEVVENNVTGFVIDKDDESSFVEKITLLLQNHLMRERFGLMGYERYRKLFTAEKMAQSYRNEIIIEPLPKKEFCKQQFYANHD